MERFNEKLNEINFLHASNLFGTLKIDLFY